MRRTAIVPASIVRPPIAMLGSISGTWPCLKASPKAAEHVPSARPSITIEYFRRFFVTCESFLVVVRLSRNTQGSVTIKQAARCSPICLSRSRPNHSRPLSSTLLCGQVQSPACRPLQVRLLGETPSRQKRDLQTIMLQVLKKNPNTIITTPSKSTKKNKVTKCLGT